MGRLDGDAYGEQAAQIVVACLHVEAQILRWTPASAVRGGSGWGDNYWRPVGQLSFAGESAFRDIPAHTVPFPDVGRFESISP